MLQVKSILGINRKGRINKTPFIDYLSQTDGQTRLSLLDRRIDIYRAANGDPRGEYQKAKNMIFNSLSGLHQFTPVFTGVVDSRVEQLIASEIIRSHKMISGPSLGVIPNLNCLEVFNKAIDQLDSAIDQVDFPNEYQKEFDKINKQLEKCQREQRYRDILNGHWEENSHHALYEFMNDSQLAKGNANVPVKRILHKGYINAVSSLTKISRANLVEWTHNGILASNVAEGIGTIDPFRSIDLLIEGGLNIKDGVPTVVNQPGLIGSLTSPAIGGLSVGSLALIAGVVSALIKAYTATQKNKERLRQEQLILNQEIEKMGFPEISADTIDFTSFQNETDPEKQASNNIAYLMAGVALITYLVSSTNQ